MGSSLPDRDPRGATWRLGGLFAALYFLQGIGEPTEGLIAQPARSLLRSWGRSTVEITTFMAILGIPWIIKPLYGLLTDFVPLFGTRRKSYLALAGGATAASLLGLVLLPVPAGHSSALLAWLLVPAVAVAVGDVAADALLVEWSQPLGLTGRLQAVQWAALYSAGILTGVLGGAFSQSHREPWAFAVCGAAGVCTLGLVLAGVREPPRTTPAGTVSRLPGLKEARPILAIGAFLALWNFNPFSNTVLHLHMTGALGFSEQFYGTTVALTAVASIAASAAYAIYCKRIPINILVHSSIVLGILSTLAYVLVEDRRSAVLVTLAAGFTYMTATLIQLDLAARVCPPQLAGTVFALLMALENLSASLAIVLGGQLYDHGIAAWGGSRRSFQALVLVGSAFTALCWLLVPLLPRAIARGDD